jgi:hypothetical protein
MDFVPSAHWNSLSTTHLASSRSRNQPTSFSDEPEVVASVVIHLVGVIIVAYVECAHGSSDTKTRESAAIRTGVVHAGQSRVQLKCWSFGPLHPETTRVAASGNGPPPKASDGLPACNRKTDYCLSRPPEIHSAKLPGRMPVRKTAGPARCACIGRTCGLHRSEYSRLEW